MDPWQFYFTENIVHHSLIHNSFFIGIVLNLFGYLDQRAVQRTVGVLRGPKKHNMLEPIQPWASAKFIQ
jgi:hypothetical protein